MREFFCVNLNFSVFYLLVNNLPERVTIKFSAYLFLHTFYLSLNKEN